jgi:transposase
MTSFTLTIEELAKADECSEKTVIRRVDDGTYIYGKHYVDKRPKNAKNRKLRFNLEACQKLFLIPPEKR